MGPGPSCISARQTGAPTSCPSITSSPRPATASIWPASTSWYRALRDRLVRAGGSPHLNAGFESSVPGLYFVGLASAATFGPLLRFVCGTEFAARRVSRAVASRIRSHQLS